jgi:hypothetical protein
MHIRSRTDDFAGFDRPSGGQLQRAASSTDSSSSTDLDARVEVFKTPTSNESPTTGQGGKSTSISSLSPDNVTSQSLKRKLLLATGKVDADSKDNDGQAPLRRAAGNGHEAVAKLLLATGKVDGRASQTPSPSPPPRPRPADSKRTLSSLPATSYATPTQKYFCVLKGCSYSKRPGFPTYDALEMHVSTVHPKRYQDLETKAKLRQQEPLHSTIPTPSPQINREHSRENTSLYGYNSRLFCNAQGCPYDANNFIGFTTKEQLNDHRENFDHSSMKITVVRPVVDDQKQQAVREQMKRSAQLINQKFYCSDGNRPYSKDKFVGYGSRAECLGHIRSYHQQEPVENAHVDVTGVDRRRIPQQLSDLWYGRRQK